MLIPEELIERALWLEPAALRPDIPKNLTEDDLGRLYAEYYPPEEIDQATEITWVWELMFNLCQEAPLIALSCIVASIRQPLTKLQVSCIAAGALEDIIADHGPVVIERIEELAQSSARFRYLLSGVWTRGQDPNGEVWQRVLKARAEGPDMDNGDPIPPVDL